jgi:hypothetical protein
MASNFQTTFYRAARIKRGDKRQTSRNVSVLPGRVLNHSRQTAEPKQQTENGFEFSTASKNANQQKMASDFQTRSGAIASPRRPGKLFGTIEQFRPE